MENYRSGINEQKIMNAITRIEQDIDKIRNRFEQIDDIVNALPSYYETC